MSDSLIGQCACGAAMTVDHVRFHCPLLMQPSEPSEELLELVRTAFTVRYSVEHVAVLGEN